MFKHIEEPHQICHTTPTIYVCWYDNYSNSHNSAVYFIDSTRDRFLVVNEDKHFRWVSINDCEIMNEPMTFVAKV